MKFNYRQIVPFILHWYDYNRRILPWRENPSPYNVWISEIMLQQTRVESVKVYFERFIKEVPDVETLSQLEDEKLMKLWEGLGYYRRARNLKKAAVIIVNDYNGKLPADYHELMKLPGIGRYTAGAISSIAFQIPTPAVDGNVLRVMKRLEGSFDDITKSKVIGTLESNLSKIIPSDRPGDFNQGIMELGAMICIPNGSPLCEQCPLMHLCIAFKKDLQMEIPVKKKKKARKIIEKTILLIEVNGRYGIRQRKKERLLHNLWELPSLEGKVPILTVEEKLLEMGFHNVSIENIGESKHVFSHLEWHMIGYHVRLLRDDFLKEASLYNIVGEDILWATKEEIDKVYTLPTAFKAYRKVIENDSYKNQ